MLIYNLFEVAPIAARGLTTEPVRPGIKSPTRCGQGGHQACHPKVKRAALKKMASKLSKR